MSSKYVEKQSVIIPEIPGAGHCYCLKNTEDLSTFVSEQVNEALRVKRDRRNESSRRKVIKNLCERGVEIPNELLGYDQNDLVGLVGEIMLSSFVEDSGIEPIMVKWLITGTSKSKGIDLIARQKQGEGWKLKLYEAKHAHNEVKDAVCECHAQLRVRFRIGLDEFADEKTQSNIAGVLMRLGDFIRIGEAMGTDVTLVKEYWGSIREGLEHDCYSIDVVVLVDIKYCNDKTLQHSVSQISKPLDVGKNHAIRLDLVEIELLEKTTEEACEEFAGAV